MPSKDRFYSCLTGKKNSDKNYKHVFKVWYKFNMKTTKDYNELCLKCNDFSLADVFKKFRKNCLTNKGYA